MSISVSRNPDGSATVTCGSESVTVHASSADQSGTNDPGTTDPSQWPIFTPTGGGYSATIWAGKAGATVKEHMVDSLDAVEGILARQDGEHPVLLRFGWAGGGPMPVSKMVEAVRTSDPDRLRCEFHFAADRS